MVRSPTGSGWSAATQVKAGSPEISLVAGGQGLLCPEASIVTGVPRRVCHGLSPVAGRSGPSNGLHRNLGGPYRLSAPTSRRGKAGTRRYGRRTGS